MRNQREATARRLTDPDFQARLVSHSLLLNMVLGVAVTALTAHAAWEWMHPPAPRYFAIDGEHTPRPIVALDSPIVDDTELLSWTVKAVLGPYNIDHFNYPTQLNAASRRFTQHGWNTFAQSFIERGNFEEIKRARLLCHAQPTRAAIVKDTKLIKGALAYLVQFPIIQTCENNNQIINTPLMIDATVVRTNAEDRPDGVAVDQLVSRPDL